MDKDFAIHSLLRFTNLQWNRKYHETGTFSMQIPLEQYSDKIKYIYTKDRPEVGKVTQQNFVSQNGFQFIQLSGYFLEHELNRHVVYQKGETNIENAPEWIEQNGKAEDVAYAFFNAFNKITADGITSSLGMSVGTSQSRGKKAAHTRNGEYLDWKIYDILKPSGMSYRVHYDFENSTKKFEVWTGLDRSQDNGVNNPIIFSTRYGNIKNPNIVISDTRYRNACIVTNEQVQNDSSDYTVRQYLIRHRMIQSIYSIIHNQELIKMIMTALLLRQLWITRYERIE